MGLENMQLPPFVLQELFKHSLIDIKNEAKPATKPVSKELPFSVLGNNRRHILLIIENDESVYLPDDQLNLLLGILSACSLTMDDVAILNIKNNKSLTYITITKELKPEKLFLFGVSPHQIELPLDFPNYQIQRYNNQVYLTAPQLSVYQDNKPEKTKLWNCLKQIFDL
ncbi:MAG: hypothetical protein JWP81_5085 [Ferruginibacter sp.]|nr:hypothetical protein [Ferruginibacter sp.]